MSVYKKPRKAGGRLPTHHAPPASRGTKTRGGDPPRPCSATDEAVQRLLPVSFACPTCPRFSSLELAICVPVRRPLNQVVQTTGLPSTSVLATARGTRPMCKKCVPIRESNPAPGRSATCQPPQSHPNNRKQPQSPARRNAPDGYARSEMHPHVHALATWRGLPRSRFGLRWGGSGDVKRKGRWNAVDGASLAHASGYDEGASDYDGEGRAM